MNKIYDLYDYSLSAFSIMFSVENIQHALYIILLVLSIINILLKFVFKIIAKIKNKDFNFDEELKNLEGEINDKIK